MKIFFMGDFVTETGPAMVNKALIRGLKNKNITYSKSGNIITRIIELIYKTISADGVCFCSYSKLNFLGLKIVKIFNKKSFYIMHGYKTYEEKVNNPNMPSKKLKKVNDKEKKLFNSVDKIFCVSEEFMKFMKKAEPEFQHKFSYNHNPVEFKKIERISQKYNKVKKKKQIISIGGGMRQKNNLTVCKAIDKLNREKGLGLEFIVIGLPYTDKKEICSYDFVTYYDRISHEKVLEILSESYMYIQNSIFETFGLAIIEALACNCNLLVSNNVGAIGVIKTIKNSDLIFNTSNADEIAEKIEYILINENTNRLKQGVLREEIELTKATQLLTNKILKYMGEKH